MKLKPKIVLISILHGLLLCFACIQLQRLPWTIQGEDILIQWSIILKHAAQHEEDLPHKNDFLFVNTSYSNQLIDKLDDEGFPLGNQVITDREQLGVFAAALRRINGHKWAIFDIFFEQPTDYDEQLGLELAQMPRVIMSTTTSDKGERLRPVFAAPSGLANIESLDDVFLKYQLVHSDSLKVITLETLEGVTGVETAPHGFFIKQGNRWGINYYIPDLRISQFDLTVKREYPFINLTDAMYLDDETISALVKDRIVIVGDFLANDNLETLTGEISGPLLLANIYLSLREGEHLLSWTYLLFLICSFTLVSLIVFLPDEVFHLRIKSRELFLGGSFVFYLAVISVISYLLFNKALNVFILSFYLIALNHLMGMWRKKKNPQMTLPEDKK